MRSSMACKSFSLRVLALSFAMFACGSDGDGTPTSADRDASTSKDANARSNDGGAATDATATQDLPDDVVSPDFSIQAAVVCMLDASHTVDNCVNSMTVGVIVAGKPVSDAEVTVGIDGDAPIPMLAAPGSNIFGLFNAGHRLAPKYQFTIRRGSSRAVANGASPGDFSVSTSPAKATLNAPLTVQWTPAGFADAIARVSLTGTGVGFTYSGNSIADTGTFTIPDGALSVVGTFPLHVLRISRNTVRAPGAANGNLTQVMVERVSDLTVE